jgi:hypothetical protein
MSETDHFLLVAAEWWHPVRVVAVELPGEFQERPALGSRRNEFHNDVSLVIARTESSLLILLQRLMHSFRVLGL